MSVALRGVSCNILYIYTILGGKIFSSLNLTHLFHSKASTMPEKSTDSGSNPSRSYKTLQTQSNFLSLETSFVLSKTRIMVPPFFLWRSSEERTPRQLAFRKLGLQLFQECLLQSLTFHTVTCVTVSDIYLTWDCLCVYCWFYSSPFLSARKVTDPLWFSTKGQI